MRSESSGVPLRWLMAVFALSVVALTISCGGDDDDEPDATATVEATATSAVPAAQQQAEALCAAADATAPAGTVRPAEVAEISGIAASRRNDNVLWAHNDSGDTARAIAFSTTGEPRGVYDVAGAEAIDWEDMAIGPGERQGQDYLYFGDIGDNAAQRTEIVVYRAPEPDVSAADGEVIEADRLKLTYPDGAHDAEVLMVDPLSDDLIVVTKELITGNAGIYRAQKDLYGGFEVAEDTLVKVGEIEKARLTPADAPPESASALVRGVGWLPTGGDISPDGALIAIRTYASVFVWAREDGQSIADALAGAPCEAPSAMEPQGEAIAFAAEGDAYFTVSEGAQPPLYRFGAE